MTAGRHDMDGIAMGADGFIDKAFTISINGNESADLLLPGFHQMMGTSKIAQAFLPNVETKMAGTCSLSSWNILMRKRRAATLELLSPMEGAFMI